VRAQVKKGPALTALLARCEEHLVECVDAMQAELVIGVGRFAETWAKKALAERPGTRVASCWHPSSASPLANQNGGRDWRANVQAVLPAAAHADAGGSSSSAPHEV
jgi:hypothetical protein